MSTRCNKCGQTEPYQSDSWCLGCSALEALGSELRSGWGTTGTRALATDLLVSAVRQVRAVRRLGLAGAGRSRALTPDGADRSRASSQPLRSEIPPPPPDPGKEHPSTVAEPDKPVKSEQGEHEEESEYEEESGEEEVLEEDRAIGLKAVPKAAPEPPPRAERPEIPRRRSTGRPDDPRQAEREQAAREDRDQSRRDRRWDSRERRRRSRSRRRAADEREPGPREPPPKKKKKKRKNRKQHRAGSRHQRLWRAHQDPFKRFHHRQPDSFWDRPPRDS